MTQWDDSINEVRKQIAELKATLNQNDQVGNSHKLSIVEARSKIEQLLDSPSTPREALYQLPLVLGALTNNKLIGSLMLGVDGKVVMHNFTTQRLLPVDPITGKLSMGTFYDPDTNVPLSEDALPWQRCLHAQEVAPSSRLKMRHPDIDGEVLFEVGTVALRTGNNISGVVVLFIDATEPVKINDYIKKLCASLDKQVSSIEAAHRELKMLAEKLGVQPFGPETAAPPAAPVKKAVSKNKVLLVDDIPVNHRLLIIQLKSFGVEIDIANNGMEAVSKCQKERYALVFMDCDMPIMNGFEATEQIRKNELSTGDHLPIVAMTSYDRAGDREKCLASGMDDYLFKGVSRARLQGIIDKYVFAKEAEPIADAEPANVDSEAPDSSQDRLDLAVLREKFRDEADQILSLFFGSGATLMNCLDFAIQDQDAAAVNHFAFSFKGPCATLGLAYMSRTTAFLTADAESGRWVEAADQYQSLRAVFQRLKAESGPVAELSCMAFSN
jgi:CheY-like chemotaxis protein